jgi:D-xylose 1-dehydrogenase (NADP+, D-xylono-1,5-lactone-forming)
MSDDTLAAVIHLLQSAPAGLSPSQRLLDEQRRQREQAKDRGRRGPAFAALAGLEGAGMQPIRWGVLSTASVARLVIQANRASEVTRFVAVASRDEARAQRFAAELGLEASFGSYEALLASDLVDAVHVALPVSMHTPWTLRALEAGKHVLCEKPFATGPTDAVRCFDAAEAGGRVVVEGFMWRHHPQTILARRLLAEGAIGRLATIRAALSVDVPPGDIRRSPVLGGGAPV